MRRSDLRGDPSPLPMRRQAEPSNETLGPPPAGLAPSVAAPPPASTSPSAEARPAGALIADRGEFVDALNLLLRGRVLVRLCDASWGCQLDGAPVRHSFGLLLRFGLIVEFHNAKGFDGVAYYRITDRGRVFATQALAQWRSLPWWRRLLVRLTG